MDADGVTQGLGQSLVETPFRYRFILSRQPSAIDLMATRPWSKAFGPVLYRMTEEQVRDMGILPRIRYRLHVEMLKPEPRPVPQPGAGQVLFQVAEHALSDHDRIGSRGHYDLHQARSIHGDHTALRCPWRTARNPPSSRGDFRSFDGPSAWPGDPDIKALATLLWANARVASRIGGRGIRNQKRPAMCAARAGESADTTRRAPRMSAS